MAIAGLLIGAGFGYGAWRAADLAPKGNLDNIPLVAGAAWTLAGAMACAGLVSAAVWVRARGLCPMVLMLGMSLLVAVVISNVVWPAVGITRDQGLKELALLHRDREPLGAPIIAYRLHTSTVVFYARRNVVEVGKRHSPDLARALGENPGSCVVTHRRSLPELRSQPLELTAQARQYALLAPRSTALAAATRPTR